MCVHIQGAVLGQGTLIRTLLHVRTHVIIHVLTAGPTGTLYELVKF